MNTTDANPIGLTALAGAPPWVWAALKLTLLLLAVWTVHIGLRRSNPRWRILLWRGALVWLAVLPALIVAGPKWPVATMKMATAVPAVATPGSTDPATGNSLPTTDWAPTVGASPALAPPVVPNRPTAAWTEILMGIWLAGLAWLLSRAGWGHRRVRQLARSSAPARAATSAECARIAMALRCRLPVSVRVHAQIHTPVLLGLQRPAILLPAAMGEPGFEAELPGVLAHELAHLISRDLWWSTALHYLSLGLWFHPLFWGVRAAHDAACEKVSDATAARVVGNARSYSRTLARIALSAVRGPRILAAVPMAGSGGIRQRLEALEDHPFCEELPPRRVAAGVLIGCVMLLGLASATIGLETAPAIAAEPGKPDAKNTSPLTPTTNTDPELDERVLELLRRAQAAVGKDHEGYGKAMNDLLSLGPRVAPSLAARLRPPPPGLTSTSEANALSFQARVMLQEMGSAAQPALPKLIQGLRDGRGETYALILGEMGPAAKLAVPALVAKAQSGCAEAAVALARIDPESPATLAVLLQVMRARDRISNDISSLAWAFQLLGPRAAPAVPALAEVLSDDVPDHQEAAVRALSHIGTPEAVTALRGVLHHANGQARVRAAETVLKHHAGDAEAAAVLQAGLRDADARVRGGAVSAVSGARASLGTHAPEIVEALLEVVKNEGADAGENANWARVWAITALRSLGARTPTVVDALTDRLRDRQDMVRLYAAFVLAKLDGQTDRAVAVLSALLSSPGWDARGRAALALGELGSASLTAVPALRGLLQDAHPYVRYCAARSVWKLERDGDAVARPLTQVVEENMHMQWAIDLLSEIGPPAKAAVPALRKAVWGKHCGARAVEALARIDPPSSREFAGLGFVQPESSANAASAVGLQ